MPAFEIVMLQLNTLVGDFDGNVAQILEAVAEAEQRYERCVLLFPELTPGQKDEDSLPPYEVLDRILELYVEQDFSAEAIITSGWKIGH